MFSSNIVLIKSVQFDIFDILKFKVGDKMNEKFTTYYGLEFEPQNIESKNIYIKDIAHSLARICRFNGHIVGYYSIAQHCIQVSNRLKEQGYDENIQLCGLLHDASEAYLGDIPTPIKKHLSDYSLLEVKYQNVILKKYNLLVIWNSVHFLIKEVDTAVLLDEWR